MHSPSGLAYVLRFTIGPDRNSRDLAPADAVDLHGRGTAVTSLFQGSGLRSIDRVVLRQAPANLQRGLAAVGGRLILTADALHFQPHALNIQTQSLTVHLAQIEAMQLRWTRLFGLLPVAPTSLVVQLDDGGEHRFVIGKREQWVLAIQSARDALH